MWLKAILTLTCLCLLSCETYVRPTPTTRWQRMEKNTLCKHSGKFNSCFCVYITGANQAGIAFAPDSVCDGNEDGAIPQ